MRYFLLTSLLLALCSFATTAQENADPVADKIAPLLKENTYLLAHVDLKRLDAESLPSSLKQWATHALATAETQAPGAITEKHKTEFLQMIEISKTGLSETFRLFEKEGVAELYAFCNVEGLQAFPLALALPGEGPFSEDLGRALKFLGFHHAGVLKGFSLYVYLSGKPAQAPEAAVTLWKSLPVKERPEIAAALKLQAKSPIRIVFAPSKSMKTIVKMAVPALLQQVPGMSDYVPAESINKLLDAMETASVGFQPASPRLNMAVQLPDEKTAAGMGTLITKTVDTALKQLQDYAKKEMEAYGIAITPEMQKQIDRQMLPLKKTVNEYVPQVKKNRLILVFDEKKFEENEVALLSVLMPAFIGMKQAIEVKDAGPDE